MLANYIIYPIIICTQNVKELLNGWNTEIRTQTDRTKICCATLTPCSNFNYNINIVYTKESETADTYIERVSHELSKNHRVRVATSDGPEQMIIFGNGAMRISAAELKARVSAADRAIREFLDN